MMTVVIRGHEINPALVIIDVQNGFVSRGGSYDLLGMDVSKYQRVVPSIARLIAICRKNSIPVFYTQAIREKSGIDLLTKTHKILPASREERINKLPICIRDTWDADIVDEIKPLNTDHVILKRRDSAFQDTEINLWLKNLGVDTLVFCGIDTSICVETSLRDGFNNGYNIVLISDATSSSNDKHYESTLEIVKDYYGLVMQIDEFAEALSSLDSIKIM